MKGGMQMVIARIIGPDVQKLLAHSKNYISAEVLVALVAFLSLPIITRLLSPAEYGIMSVFISLTSIFNIIFIMALSSAISINFVKHPKNHAEYLFSNMVFLFISNMAFLILVALLESVISSSLHIPRYIIFLTGITAAANVFFTVQLSLYEIRSQSRKYSIAYGSKNILIILISIAAIAFLQENRHNGWIYTTLVLSILYAVYCFFSLLGECRRVFRIAYVKDALCYSVPLIPHALASYALRFFDQIIINQLVGAAKAGMYAFAYNAGHMMNLIVMAMNRSWYPLFLRFLKKREFSRMNRLANRFAKLVYFAAVGLILLSEEIIMLISPKEYYESSALMPIIVLSYVFMFFYLLYSGAQFYTGKTGLISLSTALAALLNIALNYMFIPIFGYAAAAWTTLFSYMMLFVFHYFSSRFVLRYETIRLGSFLPDFACVLLVFVIALVMGALPLGAPAKILVKLGLIAGAGVFLFSRQLRHMANMMAGRG